MKLGIRQKQGTQFVVDHRRRDATTMHTFREHGNLTIKFFQYIWDGWPKNLQVEDLPMMDSIFWPFGEYYRSCLTTEIHKHRQTRYLTLVQGYQNLFLYSDNWIISGIAIIGVVLQIRFPFKALKAYPRGGKI